MNVIPFLIIGLKLFSFNLCTSTFATDIAQADQPLASCSSATAEAIFEKLHLASDSNEIDQILTNYFNVLITTDANVSKSIKLAAKHGAAHFIESILTSKAELSLNLKDVNSALKEAADRGHLNIMRLLLQNRDQHSRIPVPNKRSYNEALELAAGNGHLHVVTFMFKDSIDMIHQGGINNAFSFAASKSNIEMMGLLLTAPLYNIPLPNQHGVNSALEWTIRTQNDDLMKSMFMPDHLLPLPNQTGVDAALEWASKVGYIHGLEYLLTPISRKSNPSQMGTNNAFIIAAGNGFQNIMEVLFVHRNRVDLPDQNGMNDALLEATKNEHLGIIEFLSVKHSRVPLPNQKGIDAAFNVAVKKGNIELTTHFLNNTTQKPSQAKINDLFRNISGRSYAYINAATRERLRELLRPHVGRTEGRAAQRAQEQCQREDAELQEYANMAIIRGQNNRGLAFEIHDYAKTIDKKTIAELTTRIGDRKLFSEKVGKQRIVKWIKAQYADNLSQRELATLAVKKGWDRNTPKKLSQIMTFLDIIKENNPVQADPFDLWMNGFIAESITAYRNRNNTLSCSKGIDERMWTGLRGIDPALDCIFGKAEAELLIRNFFATLNIERRYQVAASKLMTRGITENSTRDDALIAYRGFLEHEISLHNVTTDIWEENIQAILDVIEDIYDDKIKPYIASVEAERTLKAQQDREYQAILKTPEANLTSREIKKTTVIAQQLINNQIREKRLLHFSPIPSPNQPTDS
ncbi:MAG: ankyrin repeat domain-containing protein [Candidatus Paracaedibacteraceae bacterium]|nr:ankyrin repeat domain-containing protein [Candidatus Paracaedibacteraceae bacterium]